MGLYDAVHTLVKGSGGKITSPVVVFTVCVGKEISTEHRVACRPGSLGHAVCFVYGVEVVCESPKLCLRSRLTCTFIKKKKKNGRFQTHLNTRNKKPFNIRLVPFILHDIFCTRHQVVTDSLFCQQVKIPLHDSLPWERLNAELLGTLHTEMEEEDEIQEGRKKKYFAIRFVTVDK